MGCLYFRKSGIQIAIFSDDDKYIFLIEYCAIQAESDIAGII